ncbi:hypothetical protein [Natronobeatus ordinarius]|uniref:hypothetical protein n=1 Tax=Natronobeatus ordinarius TaxID=2963433 RepID=UPI0020CE29FD|nr:hypothetical protein [Natronobeatus ordinarius]
MTDRPPSPPTPTSAPTIATSPTDASLEGRLVATTSQLAGALERTLGVRLDESTLEAVLVELDRGGSLEWVTVTRDGEYVWDLTAFPDRLAAAVVGRLEAALRRRLDGS